MKINTIDTGALIRCSASKVITRVQASKFCNMDLICSLERSAIGNASKDAYYSLTGLLTGLKNNTNATAGIRVSVASDMYVQPTKFKYEIQMCYTNVYAKVDG